MRRTLSRALAPAALLVALPVVLAACGSSSSSSSGTSGATPTSGQHKGGTLTVISTADVDYIDPGQAYYQFTYMLDYAIARPLFAYKPTDDKLPSPDLAAGPAVVTNGGKTVTITIRKGVKYSPPYSKEVTAADVKYALERAFCKNIANGYAGAYFGDIVGAPAPASQSSVPDIPGIKTIGKYKLEIDLTKPTAGVVSQALVLPASAPVPEAYAKKYDSQNPSTYGTHQLATGPYMIQNNAAGDTIGYKPGKEIVLVRNPNWTGTPGQASAADWRPAYLNKIIFKEGNQDTTVASRQILQGQSQVNGDFSPPPAVINTAVTSEPHQIFFVPSGGNRYVALNTTIKPFDNLNVRKAILAIFDRNAMRLTRGGARVGDMATHFIPPGINGFDEAGGFNEPSGVDFLSKDGSPQPALAKKYMLAAKAQGLPISAAGKWIGTTPLLMVGVSEGEAQKAAEVAAAQFKLLGFPIKLRLVTQDTMYTQFCNTPSAKVAICPNVGWLKDFLDPQTIMDPTFNGKNILQANNSNWPQLNDPKINAAMAKAALTSGSERNQAWADVNKMIVAQAPGIPYIWDTSFQLESPDVNGVMNGYYTTWDLSFSSVK